LAIVLGFIACVAVRVPPYLWIHWGIHKSATATWGDAVSTSLLISLPAFLHAFIAYFETWTNPHAIENCGDRLWQMLHGPKDLELKPETIKSDTSVFDGMTPREVFGLGFGFTRRQLDLSRRRLVQALHPDRWHNAPVAERKAREEALKRVNVAYDVLRRELG
jgi:hypothetical protein